MIKLPADIDINNLIDDLRNFSWEASEILLHYSKLVKDSKNKKYILKNKNNNDPVTEADLKVNEKIIQRINEKYKNVNWEILSEENVKLKSNECNINADWVWVLDPLDGTKDFIEGTRNYAMHLALNYKKRPYIAVVLIPEKNELWISDSKKTWCERSDGSHMNTFNSDKKDIHDMRLVTSKNHKNEFLNKLIENINFKEVINMGSVGCKIASILRSDSDLYIAVSMPGGSYPKDWDFAAPEAVLKGAGGAITNINCENLTYGKSNFEQGGIIIASRNSLYHEKICLRLKEIIEKKNIFPV